MTGNPKSDHLFRFIVIGLLLLGTLSSPWCKGAEVSAAFDAANKLYDEGKFADAAAAYQKITDSGQTSATLYFNLGNACFKSGQIGKAIASYRRAEQATPRDPDIRANLQFARNQIQAPTATLSRWQIWLAKLTVNEWTVLSATILWLAFILLALAQLRPALKSDLRNYTIILFVAAALFGFCFASSFAESRPGRTAVVIAKDVSAHNGPLDESPNSFTLHDGAELRVLDQKDDWLQVTTDPQRIGWVKRNQVVTVQ
jgi:tetratricopeptide (TPR) repeat protein